jgi:hypothetical protein
VSVTLAFDLIFVMAALYFCIKFQPLFGSVDSTFEFSDLALFKKKMQNWDQVGITNGIVMCSININNFIHIK